MNEIITGACADGIPQFWFLDFSIAPQLLFYAYIPILIVSLILGILIFIKDRKSIINKIFLFITVFFSLWILNIFIQWIAIPNYYIYFAWKLTAIFEVPIFLLSIYFIDVFCNNKDISIRKKVSLGLIYLLVIIFSFTRFNISGYDFDNCEGIIGKLWYFIYGLEFISLIWIAQIGFKYYKKIKDNLIERKKILLLTIGLVLFLGIFWFSNVYGEITSFYQINLIGPIGMMIFIGLITYLIVRYHAFNVKLIAAQALVWSLIILIGSQFFFIKVPVNFVLNGVTFIAIVIFGQSLIRSVKKEVAQRQKLEVLTQELGVANEKLKSLDKLKTEFLSLASHQLRSPLTAIQGYTSMLLEGDFGAVGVKQKEAIDRVFQSSKHLTLVVEDLLNVAKIEQGGMVYTMAPFDFEKSARDMENDLSITAGKKGLKFSFETDNKGPYNVNGDVEKIRQVILNLTDNAIKYTKEGSITVKLSKDEKKKKLRLDIIDTGMGMTPEIKATLFKKFARGEGGKVNTGGSGLGLYLAKEIVEAHKGKVWVESAGAGLGSTFSMELNTI